MNTVEIHIDGYKPQSITYASCWDELQNSEQFLCAIQLLNANLKVSEFRVKAVQAFLGKHNLLFREYYYLLRRIKKASKKNKPVQLLEEKRELLNEFIFGISESLTFIYEKTDLSKQLLPKISNLYGPSHGMSDLTFIEFAKAHTFFNSYNNTKDVVYLDKLIAVLYRPARFTWYLIHWLNYTAKKRIDYSDECLHRNIIKIALFPELVKQAVYFHFHCYMLRIVEKHPHVFSKSDNGKQEDSFGYAGLLTKIAGTKFGDMEKTANTNINDILRYLEMEMVEAEKLKPKEDQ